MPLFVRESGIGSLRFIFGGRYVMSYIASLNLSGKSQDSVSLKGFSTIGAREEYLGVKGTTRLSLLTELKNYLRGHQVKEAWKTYKIFKNIYGYPERCIITDLVSESTYSDDTKILQWASNLVVSISKERSISLKPEALAKLVISLARAQLPVSAASVLRMTVKKRSLPTFSVLQVIFMHMVKTKIGVCLASNILDEIYGAFQGQNTIKSSQTELTKPDTIIFNLVLDACVTFGVPFKGYQLVELMARVGVTADMYTVVAVACIYEMIGMRDELKKFDVVLDSHLRPWDTPYQQFYDCLLSLHFKFNDIDAISSLLVNLCGDYDSKTCQGFHTEHPKLCAVAIGSGNSKTTLKLQFLPRRLQTDFVTKVKRKKKLILYKDGKIVLSRKRLAKLIIIYQKSGRINELSSLLVRIKNMLCLQDLSPYADVIDACIYLGWLETAHDIIEDLEMEKCHVSESSYAHLLLAYRNKNMFKEAQALERHMKSREKNSSCEHITSGSMVRCVNEEKLCTNLSNSIIQSIKEEENLITPSVHEFNSSIYFFSKAGMMEEAKAVYRKMQKLNIQPNATTYFHLTCGYSTLEAYREITFLWGDIKRSVQNHNNKLEDRDLYELMLISFLRGGYFERVMEIIGLMKATKMFMDKEMYAVEFLKKHRNLYWRLNTSDAKDDTQKWRIQQVQAFRKFAGIG